MGHSMTSPYESCTIERTISIPAECRIWMNVILQAWKDIELCCNIIEKLQKGGHGRKVLFASSAFQELHCNDIALWASPGNFKIGSLLWICDQLHLSYSQIKNNFIKALAELKKKINELPT